MSFLSDLFKGNVSNLGHDLNPSNAFSDAGADFSNQPGWAKGLEIGLPLALGGGLALGGLGAAGGLSGLSGLFGGLGADAGAVGAGLSDADLAAGGSSLGDWIGSTDFGATLGGVSGDVATPAAAGLTSGTSDLLSGDIVFSIPYFQRPYRWEPK